MATRFLNELFEKKHVIRLCVMILNVKSFSTRYVRIPKLNWNYVYYYIKCIPFPNVRKDNVKFYFMQ